MATAVVTTEAPRVVGLSGGGGEGNESMMNVGGGGGGGCIVYVAPVDQSKLRREARKRVRAPAVQALISKRPVRIPKRVGRPPKALKAQREAEAAAAAAAAAAASAAKAAAKSRKRSSPATATGEREANATADSDDRSSPASSSSPSSKRSKSTPAPAVTTSSSLTTVSNGTPSSSSNGSLASIVPTSVSAVTHGVTHARLDSQYASMWRESCDGLKGCPVATGGCGGDKDGSRIVEVCPVAGVLEHWCRGRKVQAECGDISISARPCSGGSNGTGGGILANCRVTMGGSAPQPLSPSFPCSSPGSYGCSCSSCCSSSSSYSSPSLSSSSTSPVRSSSSYAFLPRFDSVSSKCAENFCAHSPDSTLEFVSCSHTSQKTVSALEHGPSFSPPSSFDCSDRGTANISPSRSPLSSSARAEALAAATATTTTSSWLAALPTDPVRSDHHRSPGADALSLNKATRAPPLPPKEYQVTRQEQSSPLQQDMRSRCSAAVSNQQFRDSSLMIRGENSFATRALTRFAAERTSSSLTCRCLGRSSLCENDARRSRGTGAVDGGIKEDETERENAGFTWGVTHGSRADPMRSFPPLPLREQHLRNHQKQSNFSGEGCEQGTWHTALSGPARVDVVRGGYRAQAKVSDSSEISGISAQSMMMAITSVDTTTTLAGGPSSVGYPMESMKPMALGPAGMPRLVISTSADGVEDVDGAIFNESEDTDEWLWVADLENDWILRCDGEGEVNKRAASVAIDDVTHIKGDRPFTRGIEHQPLDCRTSCGKMEETNRAARAFISAGRHSDGVRADSATCDGVSNYLNHVAGAGSLYPLEEMSCGFEGGDDSTLSETGATEQNAEPFLLVEDLGEILDELDDLDLPSLQVQDSHQTLPSCSQSSAIDKAEASFLDCPELTTPDVLQTVEMIPLCSSILEEKWLVEDSAVVLGASCLYLGGSSDLYGLDILT